MGIPNVVYLMWYSVAKHYSVIQKNIRTEKITLYIQYKKNTKTFSQENEKDQKQNEKCKNIFHLQKRA